MRNRRRFGGGAFVGGRGGIELAPIGAEVEADARRTAQEIFQRMARLLPLQLHGVKYPSLTPGYPRMELPADNSHHFQIFHSA